MAAMRAEALASPMTAARVACHCSSVGLDDMRLPSSLTEPMSIGISLESSGAASKKERMVMMRPSIVGPIPTRGVAAGVCPGGAEEFCGGGAVDLVGGCRGRGIELGPFHFLQRSNIVGGQAQFDHDLFGVGF